MDKRARVIVRLCGGLGNQMFQYACGRAMALRHERRLLLDHSLLLADPQRHYALGAFAVEAERADRRLEALLNLRPYGVFRRLASAWLAINHGSRARYVLDRQQGTQQELLSWRGSLILEGYWQSENYFRDFADTIRRDFALPNPLAPEARELAAQISACEAVAVHVRRGDYVSNPLTQRHHGTCPPSYYTAAAAEMRRHLRDPVFFVFSDDPAWVDENLRLDRGQVVVGKGAGRPDHEDMRLMSLCRHFLIANSSFSWWAAWLATNPDKRVIAPVRWFAGRPDCPDLVPEAWLRL